MVKRKSKFKGQRSKMQVKSEKRKFKCPISNVKSSSSPEANPPLAEKFAPSPKRYGASATNAKKAF